MFQWSKEESGFVKDILFLVKYPQVKSICQFLTVEGGIIDILMQGKNKKYLPVYSIQKLDKKLKR